MAQRAGAEIVEVDASHVVMISQPQAVTDLILKALPRRQLSRSNLLNCQPGDGDRAPTHRRTSPSFGPLKQIDAGVLNVGYAEAGPADGPAVVLLHGWPYDIHSYVDVAPLLAAAGYRVIVPYLRGYGTTRFLSDATLRNGQQAALARRRHRPDGRARRSSGRSSAASTGARGRPTSSPRSGRSAARRWSP